LKIRIPFIHRRLKNRREPKTTGLAVSALDTALYALVSKAGQINIVQIGANDGRFADPIFRFVKENPERTRVVLVEPQPDVARILEENYAFHPHKQVFPVAVGDPSSSVTMYRVSRDAWDDYVKRRTSNGGEPRHATAVTSMSRKHVLFHLRKKLGSKRDDLDRFVEEIQVPCTSLRGILDQTSLFSEIDFLQVDTEGFDDHIVHGALESGIFPTVMNFESRHIPEERMRELAKRLESNGYRLLQWKKSDTLAFRWQ